MPSTIVVCSRTQPLGIPLWGSSGAVGSAIVVVVTGISGEGLCGTVSTGIGGGAVVVVLGTVSGGMLGAVVEVELVGTGAMIAAVV